MSRISVELANSDTGPNRQSIQSSITKLTGYIASAKSRLEFHRRALANLGPQMNDPEVAASLSAYGLSKSEIERTQ